MIQPFSNSYTPQPHYNKLQYLHSTYPNLTPHTQTSPHTPKPHPAHPNLTPHTQTSPHTPKPNPAHPNLTPHTQTSPRTPKPHPALPSQLTEATGEATHRSGT
ncbi:hypothetical protein Pmani_019914 [Petrolisthes manimaculis]|uniref:Uncharacterized protein n=1 Tax=Petrolisthes manimaculis TaxID=1843537 RepID=A0AAE1PJN9_9EUCA|nr:hypothetical protein Pmani_019914 [Petrolisthes manimaculis]